MLNLPVPDYFQEDSEDALRSRVQWLEADVSLTDRFFARLLRTDEGTFSRWRERQAALPRKELLGVRDVWEMMMHVLSFVNFDSGRARGLLDHLPAAAARPREASQAPPWAGSSLKTCLETHGPDAMDAVNRWVRKRERAT
jgi:hypothetical protein